MIQTYKMAFRELGRNRRRAFFSALALALNPYLLAVHGLLVSFILVRRSSWVRSNRVEQGNREQEQWPTHAESQCPPVSTSRTSGGPALRTTPDPN